jgi:energy-coupling factor transporter ATP-binding protein EcfA2
MAWRSEPVGGAQDAASVVVSLLDARPPTLGDGRLVCVDGPAGSGKTTLAAAVAALRPEARVIHMDDLYDGWDGLPRLTAQLAGLLRPLARGEVGSYRRYDWDAGRYAATVAVPPGPLLVLEGVGSGSRAHADLTTVLAWVEVAPDLRLRRGLARDGLAMEDRWRQWAVDEQQLFLREGTADRADLLVDGTGATPPTLRTAP